MMPLVRILRCHIIINFQGSLSVYKKLKSVKAQRSGNVGTPPIVHKGKLLSAMREYW